MWWWWGRLQSWLKMKVPPLQHYYSHLFEQWHHTNQVYWMSRRCSNTCHSFLMLKGSCHVAAQASEALMSVWRSFWSQFWQHSCMPFHLCIIRKQYCCAAHLADHWYIHTENKMGPRTDPYGIPLVTYTHPDYSPSIPTCCPLHWGRPQST